MAIQATERKSHGERKIFFSVLSVCIVGVLVALLLIASLGIYLLRSRAWPIVVLSKVFPFPVAQVNDEWIPYDEWVSDTNAFIRLAEEGEQSIPNALSRPEIGKAVLQSLIRNRVIISLADTQGIQVTDAEVAAAFDEITQTSVSKDALRSLHWSDAKIKEQIIRPWLLGKRLSERLGSVSSADSAVQDAMNKADIRIYIRL